MGRLSLKPFGGRLGLAFAIPAAVGAVVGILVASSREDVRLIVVVALVALFAAVVVQPLLFRELTHVKLDAEVPPYTKLREEIARLGRRGPSMVHTRDLLQLAGNAYDLHFRFRPLLIGVVSDLLALRHRIDFREHPEQAHEWIGPDLWEVVRPDRPVPEGRFSDPGLDDRSMHRLLDDLERISA